jgi:hypothetical protein
MARCLLKISGRDLSIHAACAPFAHKKTGGMPVFLSAVKNGLILIRASVN